MLYIVATPIGNLQDITLRAIEILQQVDLIATEDTRQAKKLLQHLNIHKSLIALHAHNEQQQSANLIAQLQQNRSIALITDAGTPLISDPGLPLVRMAHAQNIRVVPIPGACALITALSASGIETARFSFEGFLSAKASARRKHLMTLILETRTMLFYEAPHRILACVQDMLEIFGKDRYIVLARELTKIYETIKGGSLAEMAAWIAADSHQQQGEIVIVVSGCDAGTAMVNTDADASAELQRMLPEAQRVLTILRQELSLTQASGLAAKITGLSKKEVYTLGLKLENKFS